MADTTATITINAYPNGTTNDQRMQTIRGVFVLSQGHYPEGGIPLNWNTVEAIKAIPAPGLNPASTGNIFPIDVDVHSSGYVRNNNGVGPSGFIYIWDSVQGNLHIFESNNGVSNASGPLIEIGAAALPASVFQDTIKFTAVFARES